MSHFSCKVQARQLLQKHAGILVCFKYIPGCVNGKLSEELNIQTKELLDLLRLWNLKRFNKSFFPELDLFDLIANLKKGSARNG